MTQKKIMKSAICKLLLVFTVISTVLLTACNKKCNCDLGPEDWTHFIPKDSAQRWINNYKARYVSDTAASHAGICANLLMLGRGDDFKHGKWMMGSMMCRDSVIGFRIYYGIKTNAPNSIIPILVGVAVGTYNDVYWKKPKAISSLSRQKTIFLPGDDLSTTTIDGAMDLSQKIPPPMSAGSINMFQ